jgi:hypothetical protein
VRDGDVPGDGAAVAGAHRAGEGIELILKGAIHGCAVS